jgi:hypothetical protein
MHVTKLTPQMISSKLNEFIDEGGAKAQVLTKFSQYLQRNIKLLPVSMLQELTPDELALQESSLRMRKARIRFQIRDELRAEVRAEVEVEVRRDLKAEVEAEVRAEMRRDGTARRNRTRQSAAAPAAAPRRRNASHFHGPETVGDSFYAGSHSADFVPHPISGGTHTANTGTHSTNSGSRSAGARTHSANTGRTPVQEQDPRLLQSFYIPHTARGFRQLFPRADLDEYRSREIEEEPAQDVPEDVPEVSQRSAQRSPSPPSLPLSGGVNVSFVASSPPGVSPSVENWGTDRQDGDENEEAKVETTAEPAAAAETEPNNGTETEQTPFGDAAPKLNTEEPVVEPEQRDPTGATDQDDSALVPGDTIMSDDEPEVPKTGEDFAGETDANGNIQHDFILGLQPFILITDTNGESQETNDETETQGNSQDHTQLTNDSGYTSQEPVYASQEEVHDLIGRMDDRYQYRAPLPRQLRSSPPGSPAALPPHSGAASPRSDGDSPRSDGGSPHPEAGSPRQMLGKHRCSSDAPEHREAQPKRLKLTTVDAQHTVDELAARAD